MSEEKMKHSPLPWSEHLVDEVQIVSRVGDYDEVCTASGDYDHDYERMYANAQFIVTACNSYYDNQQAIAELVEMLEEYGNVHGHSNSCDVWESGNCDCLCREVGALIAKHKAKP